MFVAACLELGKGVLALVIEQVLEVTPLEEVSDLEAESYAVWGLVTVISMKLAVLVISCLGSGLFVFRGHLTVLPMFFMMATHSIGSTLSLYSGIRAQSPWCDVWSLG